MPDSYNDYNILFFLLLISTLFVLLFAVNIIRIRSKQQIHYAFGSVMILLTLWSVCRLIQYVIWVTSHKFYVLLEYLVYVGVCLLPVAVFMTGYIFAKTRINFTWKFLLLLVVPVTSLFIVFTNSYHHLFIVRYSFISTEFIYGPYYAIHEIYSYGLIVIGLIYLLVFSVKNAGFFSRQSMLIFIGVLVPLVVVVASTQKILVMPVFVENISFSFGIICFSIAIFKFQFLNIAPIALQKIVDLISDSYIVVNGDMEIIDYNQTFVSTFGSILLIRRKDSLVELLSEKPGVDFNIKLILKNNVLAVRQKRSVSFENHIRGNRFDRFFETEIIPIYSANSFLGSILLFKDVSEHKKNIETIKRNQEVLMEQERMASLGQMIGGIAHNLKTPIMSIAGGIEGLKDLVEEYRSSIGDPEVTVQDHREIAAEMDSWLDKMKPYCSYMSDVITAVKGQAVQMNDSSTDKFTVEELTKRVELLMKHELKASHCTLETSSKVNTDTEIKGELNNLVQVFDNIIINAIHAYEGESGVINLDIKQKEDQIEFTITDKGKGIPKEVQNKLFHEMVTTKGKNGTGLGLYMSYSTVRGRFGGNMWFQSKVGEGTTFHITIPRLGGLLEQEVQK